MPTPLEKFQSLLRELFQFEHADLDFGIYRIMNLRRDRMEKWINEDLPKRAQEILTKGGETADDDLAKRLEILKADLLAADPTGVDADGNVTNDVLKQLPKGEEYLRLKEQYDRAPARTAANLEPLVYNHLYDFFSRYYDNGDFIPKRRRSFAPDGRDTYAVPWDGEEVVLHWANKDQYYIKTGERFNHYRWQSEAGGRKFTVEFRLTDADLPANNNKDAKKKFYLLVPETVEWQDNESTLIAPFHYRGLTPEEEGQLSGTQEAKLRESVIQRTTETLRGLLVVTNVQHLATALMAPKKDGSGQVKIDPKTKEPVPLLVHHLNRWSVKNEADFFIHKNLRRFLSGELDYFLKSVVFNIDNVLAAGEPRIYSNFRLLDAVHRLGREIIDFVSQLEDFQKALFEKKKFILETHYCVTVDQIPQRLYDAILRNEAQVQEWRRLFAIDEIERDTTRPAFTDPLTAEFLSANLSLVVDTKFFDAAFKDDLVESFFYLDQLLGCQLIWADNFQALNLLVACYHEAIDGIYIDPPYNTDASAIAYKNNYKDSSWLALIGSRLELARRVLTPTGIICVAIDDEEAAELNSLLRVNFEKRLGVAVVRSNPAGRKTKGKLAPAHEYAFFFGKSATSTPGSLEVTAKRLARYPLEDEKGRYAWANFIRSGSGDKREDRPTMYYPIYVSSKDKMRIPKLLWDESEEEYNVLEPPKKTEKVVYPIVEGIEKRWQRGFERVEGELEDYRIRRSADGTITIDFKTRMDDEALPITWWDQKEYASANYGAAELKDLFGKKVFDFAKARRLVEDCLLVADRPRRRGRENRRANACRA